MARIIFGVQGEGMGHAIRCSILIKELQKRHKIKIFTGNRALKFLKTKFKDVNEIEVQNIVYKNNRVSAARTIALNFLRIPKFRKSYGILKKAINEWKPDIIISDFEWISNLAGVFSKQKLISINNQNDVTLTYNKAKFSEIIGLIYTLGVTNLFTWGANQYIVYSINPRQDTKKRCYVGNLIEDSIKKISPKYGNHIFVYQTSQSDTLLIKIMKELNEKFVIYGFNKEETDKNLTYRKFNNDIFYKDLGNCKAMIVNGGLTTITEAIYLKKPIFSIPVRAQFEQVFNARTIEEMGFGILSKKADKEKIKDFLKNLNVYRKNLNKYKGMNNSQIIKKIEEQINEG